MVVGHVEFVPASPLPLELRAHGPPGAMLPELPEVVGPRGAQVSQGRLRGALRHLVHAGELFFLDPVEFRLEAVVIHLLPGGVQLVPPGQPLVVGEPRRAAGLAEAGLLRPGGTQFDLVGKEHHPIASSRQLVLNARLCIHLFIFLVIS